MNSPDERERSVVSEDELVTYFERGAKDPTRFAVGAEHEKIGVYMDTLDAVEYAGPRGIQTILERLRDRGGFEEVREGTNVIALEREGESVSIEPGGQLENSGPALRTAAAVAAKTRSQIGAVRDATRDLGIEWLATGFRPFGSRDDVPWVPKGRYAVMREYMPTRGRLALDMMKRTATVQANLDYSDEEDAARKLRAAYGVSAIVTALFAASPLAEGRPSGLYSTRAATWLETDPDRCGLLPFAYEGRPGLFRAYTRWALDVPMLFLYRGGYRPVHLTFRRFMREGAGGERATWGDWVTHLSTLFPENRLKTFIEVRSADASTADMVTALPALWRGLLYDPSATDAAWRLVDGLTFEEREQLRRDVPRLALDARVRGRTVRELAAELVAIARAGLSALPGGADDQALLAPLDEVAATGRTVAHRILDAWHASAGDARKLVSALAL